MKINIRKAQQSDFQQAHELIKELAEYEKAAHEVQLPLNEFVKDGTADPPAFHLHVAVNEEQQVVAMALYYIIYSTWKGKIVYLDDLVVTEKYRRSGLGSRLMKEVIRFAIAQQARQLRWHVLDWNEPAINLYKKMGAKIESDWDTCKMTLAQMKIYESL